LIHLFTDFGWNGPYVGEMKAVLARELVQADLVDLMHDAPKFNPRASAYLLAALSQRFVASDICLGVVDPGVGDSNRRAVILDVDGVLYVGPDNGLFAVLIKRAKQVSCREILWRPVTYSHSFHGRDIFAPVVSFLKNGMMIDARTIPAESLYGSDYPKQLPEVIYIDCFGNAVTGLDAGEFNIDTTITFQGRRIKNARTFASVPRGELFWYANSMGLIEIAANQASAAEVAGLSIGAVLKLGD
jgi:S-adenosylmethionine hydrolase